MFKISPNRCILYGSGEFVIIYFSMAWMTPANLEGSSCERSLICCRLAELITSIVDLQRKHRRLEPVPLATSLPPNNDPKKKEKRKRKGKTSVDMEKMFPIHYVSDAWLHLLLYQKLNHKRSNPQINLPSMFRYIIYHQYALHIRPLQK